jgi:multidrug resistance efflux pump
MQRLRRRPRYDALRNEARRRSRSSWGRWLYLALVAGLLLWIVDGFFGRLLYFRAEGIALRERVVLATQYPAAVTNLQVVAGSSVAAGDRLATLRSREVEERLAELAAKYGELLGRVSELRVRREVIEAVHPLAVQRLTELRDASAGMDDLRERRLATTAFRVNIINDHFASLLEEVRMAIEGRSIAAELPELETATAAAREAVEQLKRSYAGGALVAPVGGIVGYLHASEGTVINASEPIMEIFTGSTFILAYLPGGTLYQMEEGDAVDVRVGLRSYNGRIAALFPFAAELPREFQKTFQPVDRAQVARIALDRGEPEPPLFAKVNLGSRGFPPVWLTRLAADWIERASALAP